jgi:hypothetical protein
MTTSSINHKRLQERKKNVAVLSLGVLIGFFTSSLLFFSFASLENKCVRSIPLTTIQPSSSLSTDRPLRGDDGWKLIHVFYGDKSHVSEASTIPLPYFQENFWFSQYRQDEIVSRLLHNKRNGFFIDLAANDAVRISNTYSLETHFDWKGICLEPNPVYWNGLSYRKCHVAAAVVGTKSMDEVTFKFPKDKGPKGGIVGNGFDNKNSNSAEGQRKFTIQLSEVLRRFHAPRVIDYISLDVEGAEDLVMSAFPFSEYRFNILTVERPSTTLASLLQSNDYVLLATLKIGKETLWVHRSIQTSLDISALSIDSQNYKYRENTNHTRIAPEVLAETDRA